MSADDDKALTWDEVSDPTHVDAAEPSQVEPTPVVEPVATKPAASSALLVTYGIVAGAYLVYTVGWIVSIFNDNRTAYADILSEIMYQFGEFLAIASPALWFVTVLLLTRGRKPVVRLVWLLLGLAVVIPWPFVLLGA